MLNVGDSVKVGMRQGYLSSYMDVELYGRIMVGGGMKETLIFKTSVVKS